MEKRNLITQALIVKSLAHNGYRRAGLAFNAGENTLAADTITPAQLAMLEADPRLALLGTAEDDPATQGPTAPADDTPGAVVQAGLSGGVAKKKKATAKATPTKKDE
ncbi:HI1506-related protein [Photobacterium nomapromontoriensis]|uniref:HI1506-related protein n=1 Tax=Photobacterium nomapromontoriensis TaxID=2910237 RepID=UPI003D0C56E7